MKKLLAKTKEIDISLFEILDEVARRLYVNDSELVGYIKAINPGTKLNYPSRIAELRMFAKSQKLGEDIKTIKRPLTIDKCADLINGLKDARGESVVMDEILSLLDRAKDDQQKMILLALATREEDQAEMVEFMKARVRASLKKKMMRISA